MKRPVWIALTAVVFLCLLCMIALLATCCLWRSTTCLASGAAKSASIEDAAIAPSLPKGTCGETGSLSLLFIGADYSGGNPPPGADAIRLIRVDYDVKTVQIVSLPRDLWLPTPGLNDPNMPEQTLGLAYYYKKQASTGSDKSRVEAGTAQVARMILDSFGLLTDHYLTLQLDSVADMIDTVGGVEVNLPAEVPTEFGLTFPAGQNVLDGRTSAYFVRTLKSGGEAGRMQRQNIFARALVKQLIGGGWISQTPQLLGQFDAALTTDLSWEQLSGLVCMVETVPESQTTFIEVVGDDWLVTDGSGHLVPEGDEIRKLLELVFGK